MFEFFVKLANWRKQKYVKKDGFDKTEWWIKEENEEQNVVVLTNARGFDLTMTRPIFFEEFKFKNWSGKVFE